MSELTELVSRLNKKMEFVLQHASSLKEQISEKDAEIASLRLALKEKEESFAQLSERMSVLEAASALSGDSDEGKRDARLKINELVREIDKCIALLNK